MEMVIRLPKNYVEVADDEMEYVEGSGKWGAQQWAACACIALGAALVVASFLVPASAVICGVAAAKVLGIAGTIIGATGGILAIS